MTSIKALKDEYQNFSFVDLDAPGGFARVCQVSCMQNNKKAAFKVMRPEVFEKYKKEKNINNPFDRFAEELRILDLLMQAKKNKDNSTVLSPVTDVYDSGFISKDFIRKLIEANGNSNSIDDKVKIWTTGINTAEYIKKWKELENSQNWLPFLVVELAEYDDSMFRRIHRYSRDTDGIYRLATLEALIITIKLLDLIEWLQNEYGIAYFDWKPEHIYWNGKTATIRLIDWNVTVPLKDSPGEKANRATDVRLLAGSALYSSLTLTDLDDKPIVSLGTRDLKNPIQEVRKRYFVENPKDVIFYRANKYLDTRIKEIVSQALAGKYERPEDLRLSLLDYAKVFLGVDKKLIYGYPNERISSEYPYANALIALHKARHDISNAQHEILHALEQGDSPELRRMSATIRSVRNNFPVA